MGGFSLAGVFAYIAGSPFVFIKLYGLPADRYGWLFGANSLGLVAAAQVNGRLLHGVSPRKVMVAAGLAQGLAGLLLAAAARTGAFGIAGLIVPLFAYLMALGFIAPNATALAMAPHGRVAGAASALLGTLQFTLAAIAPVAVGAFEGSGATPMAIVVAACGALGLLMNGLIPAAKPLDTTDRDGDA